MVLGSARDTRAPRQRAGDRALVLGAAVIGGLLCCYRLTGRSLGFDEGATAAIVAQHGAALGSAIARDGGNMSGYYVLLHLLIGLFGDGAFVLRLPSVIATAATAGCVCALASRLFDRRVALASGVLTVVSLPLVLWGQAARGYAPMVACVTASFLAFAVLVDRDAEGASTQWPWLAYLLCTILGVYASFVAVLAVPAQLVSLAVRRRALAPVAAAAVAGAVCCVPLAVLAVRRGSGQLFWVPRPDLAGMLQVLESLTSSGLQPSFRLTSTSIVLLCATLLVLLAAGPASRRRRMRRADTRRAWSLTLVGAWLVVPVVLVVLESFVGQSIFLPRNLLMCLPAVAMIVAFVLLDPRLPGAVSWLAIAAVVALRALQLAPTYGVSPEDWRAASADVSARSQPGDCIAFYPSDGRMAFAYYHGSSRPAPRPVLPAAPWTEVRPYVEDYATLSGSELRRLPSQCRRLWFVSSHEGQPHGPPISRANYARFRALNDALAAEFRIRRTVWFGYAAPVRVQLLVR